MKKPARNKSIPKLQLPEANQVEWDPTVDEELLNTYLSSSKAALERLEAAALELEDNPEDEETRGEIKRIIHTIKGDSGLVGLSAVADVCHQAEDILEQIESRGESSTQFILEVKDWLQETILCEPANNEPVADINPQPPAPEKGAFKALIVEDDFTSRVLLQKLLTPYGETHVAADGYEAVKAVAVALEEEQPYELICLDIMMPNMDGHAALRNIRKQEKQKGVLLGRGAKIIMTTALDDAENVMKSFNEQCEAYLVKPIRKDALLKQLVQLGLLENGETE